MTAALNAAGTAVVLTNATGNDISVADTAVANAGNVTVQKLDSAGAASGAALTPTAGRPPARPPWSATSRSTPRSLRGRRPPPPSWLRTPRPRSRRCPNPDITTFAKATDALEDRGLGAGLHQRERAKLGALQSRFETSICEPAGDLGRTLRLRARGSSTRTFAQETANLSRAQILQQAGTADGGPGQPVAPGRAGPALSRQGSGTRTGCRCRRRGDGLRGPSPFRVFSRRQGNTPKSADRRTGRRPIIRGSKPQGGSMATISSPGSAAAWTSSRSSPQLVAIWRNSPDRCRCRPPPCRPRSRLSGS